MASWTSRVRVTERTRRNFLTGASRPDGFRVEVRLSADGEPERWENAAMAAIFGPVAVVEALDAAREPFTLREDADAAAARIVAALDEAT